MGLVDKIKEAAEKQGGNKSKFAYWKSGDKKRIRFLADAENGMEIMMHDSFSKGVNVPCQKLFGRKCPYCDDAELRTRPQYAWSIYDYDSEEVKVFMFPVNSFTPVLQLMDMYEAYGTLLDRDYLITRTGKQKDTSYSVVPMDKAKFRDTKVKPFSESSILKMLNAAYPADNNSDDEEETADDDDLPFKVSEPKTKAKIKDISDDEIEITVDDDEKLDYSEMTAKALYKLCDERGIVCEMKKPAKYYIELLEHWDKAESDWKD